MPSPDQPSAEHRFLSVLFLDMVDSTDQVFRLGAERFAEILGHYRSIVFDAVKRHGGIVARVIGDGVLAYFGWPRAGGRDAEAAVACALAISERISRQETNLKIPIRIAIETGWVLVGDIGADQNPEGNYERQGVVGLAPHIAARLQRLAPPNGVIVGEGTLPLLGGRFLTKTADTTGLDLPVTVRAAHVLGEAGHGDPLGRLRAYRDRGPPIGRTEELAILRSRWRLARAGDGQAILLSGEPGIGKSRLLGALLDDVSGDSAAVTTLFCSAVAKDSPFRPLNEPLRLIMGLDPDSPRTEVQTRAAAFARALGLNQDVTATALATLLGAPPADPPPPSALRRHILESLLALADRLSRDRPLLIVAEDIHWADDSTTELLRHIAEVANTRRLLLIVTYRSELVLAWPDRPHIYRLALGPLREDSAHYLASETAEALGATLDEPSRVMLVERAEGTPFFIEEFVRTIAGRALPSLPLPGSVAQLLASRLDALGPARSLGHLAAVIGREIPAGLLEQISGLSRDEFDAARDRLTDTGVMTRRGSGPATVLAFRHSLLADAAYHELQSSRRRMLHRQVAEAMRRIGRSDAGMEPAALARHFELAGESFEAATLFREAAAAASSSGGFVEAEAHARHSLQLADGLPEEIRSSAQLTALGVLGDALIATRGYADPEVQQTFERGARLALKVATARDLLPVLRGLTSFYQVRGPLARARELSERVLQVARQIGEPLLIAQAERRYGWCRFCQGELGEARLLLETALSRQVAAGSSNADLAYDDATTLATLAWLDWLTDGEAAALERADRAAARAEISTRPLSATYAFGFSAIVHQLAGDYAGTRRLAERCREIAGTRNLVYWTAMADVLVCWTEAVGSGSSGGLVGVRDAVAAYRRTQSQVLAPYILGLLAESEHAVGTDGDAIAALDGARQVADAIGAHVFTPSLHLARGRVLGGAAGEAMLRAAQREATTVGAMALARLIAEERARLRR